MTAGTGWIGMTAYTGWIGMTAYTGWIGMTAWIEWYDCWHGMDRYDRWHPLIGVSSPVTGEVRVSLLVEGTLAAAPRRLLRDEFGVWDCCIVLVVIVKVTEMSYGATVAAATTKICVGSD